MSHVELVQVRTADGVRLDGSLAVPKHDGRHAKPAIDAVLAVHGTGANFYTSAVFDGLTPKLLADGIAVLRVNTRGHDVISTAATLHGAQRQGSALERVDDCRHDLVGWTEFLTSRGHESIAVIGHSLGAIKAVYAAAVAPHPAVKRLVAISPPRLSHAFYLTSAQREEFLKQYRLAETLVAEGRGNTLLDATLPLSFLFSASNYLDKYGPEEKYNFLRYIDRLSLPALFVFGGQEIEDINFSGLPEATAGAASPTQDIGVVTIAGANHVYTGQLDELAHKIRAWLSARS